MAYDRAAEVGRQEPAGASQNAERYCRINDSDLQLFKWIYCDCWLVPYEPPSSWLVPSNAALIAVGRRRTPAHRV
jgi:hypothetical protein